MRTPKAIVARRSKAQPLTHGAGHSPNSPLGGSSDRRAPHSRQNFHSPTFSAPHWVQYAASTEGVTATGATGGGWSSSVVAGGAVAFVGRPTAQQLGHRVRP
jgi:hypothetical protein